MKKEDLLILKDLVRGEAAKLREVITKKEAVNLDFNYLDGQSMNQCVYGQLTGYCFSARAQNLILKCCQQVYTPNKEQMYELKNAILNGKPHKVVSKNRHESYYSPIEKWLIVSTKKAQKNLIQYLKKEVDTLDI